MCTCIETYVYTYIQHIYILSTFLYYTFIQRSSANLKRSPTTLEDLKFVLSAIANIRAISLDVELRYRDIRERYRTLVMYDVKVCFMYINIFVHYLRTYVHICMCIHKLYSCNMDKSILPSIYT